MAQAQAQTALSTDIVSTNRLVWVLNTHVEPYKDNEFQGMNITIPPMCEKVFKHVRDGGNLMEFLAARKFLGALKVPQGKDERGTPVFGPKALQTMELTETEREKLTDGEKVDAVKEAAIQEKKARRQFSESLKKNPVTNKMSLAEQDEP